MRGSQRTLGVASAVWLVLLTSSTAVNAQGLLWAKRAGGANVDSGLSIAVDGSGNSYVTGAFRFTATFGLGEVNETILTAAGNDEIFVAKYSPSGELQWAKPAGGEIGFDSGVGIAVDSSGNSYVTGYFQATATFGLGQVNETVLASAGDFDIFIAKYNGDGTLVWATRAGGTNVDLGSSIAVDGSGVSNVTGTFSSNYTPGQGGIFVAKYNADGTLAWMKRPGPLASNAGYGIAVDDTGATYVTGFFDSTATFGAGETNQTMLPSLGLLDIFIAKFGGTNLLRPAVVDFDGDGKGDVAVYETSIGTWCYEGSTSGIVCQGGFGGPGYVPVPGDYDGDRPTDIAVYETINGNWYWVGSTSGFHYQSLGGGALYVPVPGDYDGDGITEIATYRTIDGLWIYRASTSGSGSGIQGGFGGPGYVPVPGDYDGDGITDIAVYEMSIGTWCYVGSTSGIVCQGGFGGPGFDPVPADYDGDGTTDMAVYEIATGHWFINRSTAGFQILPSFGGTGFVPVLPQETILRAMGLL